MNWLEEKENNEKSLYKIIEEYKKDGITIRCIEWPKNRPICIYRTDEIEKANRGEMKVPTNIIVPGFNIEKYSFSIDQMIESVIVQGKGVITHIGIFKIKDKSNYYGIVGIPSDFAIVEDFFDDLFLYGTKESSFKC